MNSHHTNVYDGIVNIGSNATFVGSVEKGSQFDGKSIRLFLII